MFKFHGWPATPKYFNNKHLVDSVLTRMAGKCGLVDQELQHSETGRGHSHAHVDEVIVGQ